MSEPKERRCGFCGKLESEVDRLVPGPVTCICNECVDLLGDVMRAPKPEEEFPEGRAWLAKHKPARSDDKSTQGAAPVTEGRIGDGTKFLLAFFRSRVPSDEEVEQAAWAMARAVGYTREEITRIKEQPATSSAPPWSRYQDSARAALAASAEYLVKQLTEDPNARTK